MDPLEAINLPRNQYAKQYGYKIHVLVLKMFLLKYL